MCGIAGLYSFQSQIVEVEGQARLVKQMTNRMIHRGPDADGIWADSGGRCVLGHRRLSIIDVSDAGRQPMQWGNGEWVISFNGEIYNFLELKRELNSQGVQFHGRTDTEVLLAALATWGLDTLTRLDGMFAFAAFHVPSGELILARDPFGEKPLYYMETGSGAIAFASELQCLEEIPGFNAEISVDAMAELLMFQYIGAPRTIYQNIKKLSPGHLLVLKEDKSSEIRRYFKFAPGSAGFSSSSREQLADELEDILVRSLKRRLISDVPLGAFLSGGVDSSTVCALARRKLGVPLQTFSIGFQGAEDSEHELARLFSKHLGTEHRDKILVPSATDFLEHAGQYLDEPNGDSSCLPTYLLSQFARQYVTVALSGDGGDELFGGYGRYFETLGEEKLNRSFFRSWSAGRAYYSGRILVFPPEHLMTFLGLMPTGAETNWKRLVEEIDGRSVPLLCQLRATDTENYMPGAVLPKVDRMSMQHSLEVRTPFLNVELARFAERVPTEYLVSGNAGKLLLKDIAYRYLPKEIIDMPKKGFGLPMGAEWGREAMLNNLTKALGPDSRLGEWLGEDQTKQFFARQSSADGFAIYQVWSVVMLEHWLRNRPSKLPERERVAGARYVSGANVTMDLPGTSVRYAGWLSPTTLIVSSPKTCQDGCHNINSLLGWGEQFLAKLVRKQLNEQETINSANQKAVVKIINHPNLPGANPPDKVILDALELEGWGVAGKNIIIAEGDGFVATPYLILALQEKKVASLVAPATTEPGSGYRCYRFNYFTGWKRFSNLLRLRRDALSVWQSGSEVRHGAYRYDISVPGVNSEKTGKAGDFFGVFEGPNQLPPVSTNLKDIENVGGGRYIVDDGMVHYSLLGRRGPRHLMFLDGYWAIRINAINRKLLPIQVEDIVDNSAGSFQDALNYLVDESVLTFDSNHKTDIDRGQINKLSDFKRNAVFGIGHVVLYTHGLSAGGAERQWCYLAKGLKSIGLKVTFVVDTLSGPSGHYLPLLIDAGINIYEITAGNVDDWECFNSMDEKLLPLIDPTKSPIAENVVRLVRVLKILNPDAVISQLDVTNIVGAVAALLAGVPKVAISFRNYNPTNFPYLDFPWLLGAYRALARSPKILMTGNSIAGNDDYANWIGVDSNSVKLLKNAIDISEFQKPNQLATRALQDEFNIKDGEKLIVGVFRLSQEKDPVTFIRVCTRVISELPSVRAIIVGEGPMKAELEKIISDLQMEEKIMLAGRRLDVVNFIGLSSVLLLTSRFEGTPNVILEAKICGVPVVATKAGAVPELIRNGEDGFVFEFGDVDGLAEACITLLTDDELHERIVNNMTTQQMDFTAEKKAMSLINFFESHCD